MDTTKRSPEESADILFKFIKKIINYEDYDNWYRVCRISYRRMFSRSWSLWQMSGCIKEKIDFLKEGKVPFYEPGLKNKITNGLNNGTLEFTSSYDSVTKDTNIYFICVGSPPKKDGSTNLSYVSNSLKKDILFNEKGLYSFY